MTNTLNHWNADKVGIWSDSSIALGNLLLYNTEESFHEQLPYSDSKSGLCITADARIDNREYLAKSFGIKQEELSLKPDSWFILTAFQQWGKKCTEHLEGDFAFAIWDQRNKHLFCARDQIGIKPFYYYYKNGFFVFATEIKGILAVEQVDQTLNERSIANFLTNIKESRTSTIYQHIHRLEAAHQLSFKAGKLTKSKYWELDLSQSITCDSEEEYSKAFVEKLEKAVKKRLRTVYPICTELSGGLDSSTITAIASNLMKKEGKEIVPIADLLPNSVSHDDPLLIDDRKKVQELISYLGIENYHCVTGENTTLIDSLEKAAKIHDEPPTKLVNVFADQIYEKANSIGSRLVLSGFGGDDVTSYQGYFFYEDLLRSGKWKTLWKELKLSSKKKKTSFYIKLINTFFSSLLSVSGNYRYFIYLFFNRSTYRFFSKKFIRTCIRPKFAKKHQVKSRFFKSKLFNYKGKSMNEKIADRLVHPTVLHYRLEYFNLVAAHNRTEYRYPLLDIELIQFFISVPTTEKIKNGVGRYLFRNSVKHLIPEKHCWENSKQVSSSPSFIWKMYRDKELMTRTLKQLPINEALDRYIDVKKYIKLVEKNAAKKQVNNYKGNRLYLLYMFFKKIGKS